MKEQVREILRDLIWAVLNGDDLDKWMEVRDSTSPDLQGFLDIYDSGIDQRVTQICDLFPVVKEDKE